MVIAGGLRLTAAGLALGLAGALVASQFLSSLPYQTDAFDAVTFASVAGFLVAAALVASYIPARRAMHLDPLSALRQD